MNESSTTSAQDRVLMSKALDDFNSRNYADCLNQLNKIDLNASPGVSTKVELNRAVAEFYKNGLRKHAEFTAQMNQLLAKIPSTGSLEMANPKLWIPFYNKALVLFNLRQPQAALKILLSLMPYLNEMDEFLVQRAGLLTINILLNSHQVKKAGILIEMMQLRLNISPESLVSDDEDDDLNGVGIRGAAVVRKDCPDLFRWMFRLYTIRWNVLSGKNILIANEDTSELSVLRAHQFYNGIDYQMAAKELSKQFSNVGTCIEKNGEDHNTVIANNMGIIHFHVRHYAMAVRFFQHALTFDQVAASDLETKTNKADLPIQCIGATKRPEILYNLGVSMLHLQRPKEAFECLLVPLNYYHNNPRIWLRLAEACIMVHNQDIKSKENKNIVSSVIGSGIHRKYVIQPTPMKYVSDDSQSFAIPSPNLEFASLCLRNALTLVEYHVREFKLNPPAPPNSSQTLWQVTTEKSACSPSKPPTQQTLNNLLCAILAAYSYVQICLGDYLLALENANKLILLECLPDAYAMLGHLYCAEALIMLDRVNEARLYLEPKFIAELKEDDFVHRGSPDWNINTLDAAQSILKYNLAVTLLLNGEQDLARTVLSSCNHPVVYTQLKMMKIYMELQVGNLENCRMMIRMDTPQHS